MGKMLTSKEISKLWGVPDNQVTRYCRENRIAGAKKESGNWLIPHDAPKPVDGRKTRGSAKAKVSPAVRKPLPIGVSNYRDACTNYYYVDKTLLIRDFLDERAKVSLFTRPRRFGKTLTMDMLKTFFERSVEDTSVFFQDKDIWECGEEYRNHQGKYPVIFLTFKDVKCETWEETYDLMAKLIRQEFKRHCELAVSDAITNPDYYQKVICEQATENDYMLSLMYLSQMLDEHHGVAPIIIIDEYDTPIQQGHACGFYDRVVLFMRNLFSGGLKDNKHLSYGFLTGILRVAKESIFSGLNNLSINSILDDKYSQYFGFTADEVRTMADYHNAADKFDEICEWYDGYRFGPTEIFNPWSVINYFNKNCKPERFWENTGSNAIIGEVLEEADEEILENLNDLLQGNAITTYVDTNVIYPEIKRNPSSVYSFLLVAGYLKVQETGMTDYGDFMCKVSLPNKEITLVYRKEIINRLQQFASQSIAIKIQEALYTQNMDKLQKNIQKYLLESVSSYDIPNENAYHMLLLGLCAIMSDKYYIRSNRESGKGRFDIQLMPRVTPLPGFLVEVKAERDCSAQKLEELAQAALRQIEDREYDTEMLSTGISTVFKFGIAFSGKDVKIAVN